ncbi:sensor histidine kinase [Desulfoscipio geothermicus]|nr:ATP-binding protein [Desulfoscipio geothermicus]
MSLLTLLLVSLPEALLVTMLGFQLAGLGITPRQLIITGMAQTASSYFIRLSSIPFGLHSLVQIAIYILIIRFVTGIPLRRVAIIALLGLVIYGTLDAAIIPPLLSITGYSLPEILSRDGMRIGAFLTEASIILLFIIACRRYNFHLLDFAGELKDRASKDGIAKKTENAYLNLYILVLLPVLMLAVLNIVLFVSQTGALPSKYFHLFAASFGLILITITVLSMGVLTKISILKEKELEARQAGETIVHLDKLIKTIRKQRHDFNHHLQAVYGLLEVGSCDKARDYVKQMFLDISNPAEVVKTDNPGISAMLFAKAGQAEARGIPFSVSMDCSLQSVPLSTMEANSLLGNLLDNAIEAAAAYTGAHRSVRLEITREPGEYIFTVANTGDPIPPETRDRMCELHYSTKKSNQGLGLTIVKEIVDKYSGRLTVEHAGGETIFSVHIPNQGAGRGHDRFKQTGRCHSRTYDASVRPGEG